ncbi:MAG: YqgE/AlgH family protein [Gammaproteobacteria bacterium]|nr:YqgE/AlgH family protein [Gammaproteobacteria bacterium]NNM00981.1 YqgE/AlgH family protein [Gammaproteobacteria bacterium]
MNGAAESVTAALALLLMLACSLPAIADSGTLRGAPPRVLSEARAGIYLVANERLYDPLFGESVILLAEHNGRGSVGLIINRNTAIPVQDALPELTLPGKQKATLHIGGPVRGDSMRLLVRLPEPGFIGGPGMVPILDNVYLVNDVEVLQRVLDAGSNGRPQLRFYAGYTGWAAGQLEAEVERGDWSMVEADPEHIFATPPEELWRLLLNTANATWAVR